MKFALVLFAAAFASGSISTAYGTCTQSENQFSGNVRNTQRVTNELGQVSCTYQLELDGRPSGVCALSNADAQNLVLLDPTCARKNGEPASGVLVTRTWIE